MNKKIFSLNVKRLLENRGITLIALIITIIVLLLLSTVSITILMGENGILSKVKLAKEKTELSESEELNKLNSLNTSINEYSSTSRGYAEDISYLSQEIASLKVQLEQFNKIGEIYKKTDTITYTAKGSWVNRSDITYTIPAGTWLVDFSIEGDATSGTGICTIYLSGLGISDTYWKSSADYANVHFSCVKKYDTDTTGYLTYYQNIATNRNVNMVMNAVRIK